MRARNTTFRRFREDKIVDPTGVGDAFRGGFLRGYQLDLDWQTCGQMGALAATYCLEQRGTMTHSYTPAEFVARYRTCFDDGRRAGRIIELNFQIILEER